MFTQLVNRDPQQTYGKFNIEGTGKFWPDDLKQYCLNGLVDLVLIVGLLLLAMMLLQIVMIRLGPMLHMICFVSKHLLPCLLHAPALRFVALRTEFAARCMNACALGRAFVAVQGPSRPLCTRATAFL